MPKLYLAGNARFYKAPAIGIGLDPTKATRRLFSYFYAVDNGRLVDFVQDSIDAKVDLFLDSGAFTAFTKGATIDPQAYANFIKGMPGVWGVASSLDHIGEGEEAAQKSFDNWQHLKYLGADTRPVFHVREPDAWLKRYMDLGEDYILIGGMVPESSQWLIERLDHLFAEVICDRDGNPKAKIHGFGLTDQQVMFKYPWYSLDSASWMMTGIYGACLFRMPNGNLRKIIFSNDSPDKRHFDGWHYHVMPTEQRLEIDKWLLNYGVTAEQCASHYSYRDRVNSAVFQSMEDEIPLTFTGGQRALF